MKRICCSMCVMLLVLYCAAQAEEIEGLVIGENDLSGVITIEYVSPDGKDDFWPLVIDCPLPQAAYPLEQIKTGNRFFSKKDMQRALKAAGQSTQGHFVNNRTDSRYEGDWNAKADADISWEDAAEQAVQIGLAYFDALGVEVAHEPRRISRPYDLEARVEQSALRLSHAYENPQPLIERIHAQEKRMLKYAPKQDAYTQVDFEVMLEGMRLPEWHTWATPFPDEPDAKTSDCTQASVIVSDSGVLVQASARNIKEIKSRKALTEAEYASLCENLADNVIPGTNWQEALRKALKREAIIGSPRRQKERVMTSAGENVALPYNRALVSIAPCLSTVGKDIWIPGFTCTFTEEYEDGWRN